MLLEEAKIIIPARRNSKGLPFKNRRLISKTIEKIPNELLKNVIISTDDEEIKNKFPHIKIHHRSEEVSLDTSSTKQTLLECCKDFKSEDLIICLYTTYPERTWKDILSSFQFFQENKCLSLLCKKEVETSPFLMMFEEKDNKGRQVIKHNLYRRQDYPKCFEISHFIIIFYKKELDKLNENLYNEDTLFFPIYKCIDVDTYQDLEIYNEKNKSNS
jgi:CMP-N-acetylneuraminic acid synthetase